MNLLKQGINNSMIPPDEEMDEDMMEGEDESLEILDPALEELEYSKFCPKAKGLIEYFTTTIEPTIESNRNKRRLDTDSESLRKGGDLAADESFIPIRVIDQNIAAEIPPLFNYIVSPPRMAIFKDETNVEVNDKKLESGYTTCFKFKGWLQVFYRILDGAGCHGYSVAEVCYSKDQPGKFEIYDIGAADFLYPQGTTDIQSAPFCGIRIKMTVSDLEALKKEQGFNVKGIDEILAKNKEDKKILEKFDIFKFFIKVDGVVYVIWYSDKITSAWLREPAKHDVGIWERVEVMEDVPTNSINPMTGMETLVMVPTPTTKDVPVDLKEYPVFVYAYALNENKCIDDLDGRAMKDAAVQEAMTALWSTNVNGTSRASNVYGAPDGEVEPGTPIELLDVQLKSGNVYSRKMQFFSTPYPSDVVIRSIQALDGKNKESTGQLAATVNNRQDSRKTAAETNLAKEQEGKLDSVGIILLSAFLAELHNFTWKIVQSQAILGQIIIYPMEIPQDQMVMMQPSITPPPTNDIAVISKKYILYPAGDADYIQLEERKEAYQNYWPIAQAFPQLAPIFAADMFKDMFKSNGERYAKVLEATAQEPMFQSLAKNLFMMLEELIKNPAVSSLPEVQTALPGLQQIKQVLEGNTQQPGQGTSMPSNNTPQPTQQPNS